MVVDFLFVKSFMQNEVNNTNLKAIGINTDKLNNQIPLKINNEQFRQLIKETSYERHISFD